MKKFVSLVLIICLLFTGTIVYAESTTSNKIKARISEKVQSWKEKISEVQPLIEKVRTGTAQIIQLRKNANTAYKNAKSHMEKLIKNKNDLTQQQMEALKEALVTLKNDKAMLGDTVSNNKKENLQLAAAKKTRNFSIYKHTLEVIIATHNAKIGKLKKVIADMNQIAGI